MGSALGEDRRSRLLCDVAKIRRILKVCKRYIYVNV